MEEKCSNTAIDVEEIRTPLPLPPAATANILRQYEEEEPAPRPSSRLKLHAALIFAQLGFAGYEVVVRRSLGSGSSILIFSMYKNCLGFLMLRLVSSIVEKKQKPVLNFPALFAAFFLGVFGISVSELCYLEGMKYTAPAFSSTMRNVIPIFTFIFAMLLRMEKVEIQRRHGVVKVLGAIVLICGWMLLLIWKGEELLRSHFSFLPHGKALVLHAARHSVRLGALHLQLSNQQYGIIFLGVSCLSFSIFLSLQGFLMEKYAAPVSFASFASFFGIVQVGIVAAVHIHRRSPWLKFTIADGISLAYAGTIGSAVLGIQCWGVKQGGPTFVAAYQPLETIITIILSFFLLRENLYFGSLIGSIILLLGLYLLIWGKEREHKLDALHVVQDFHGMTAGNFGPGRASNFSTEITVASLEHDANSEDHNTAAAAWFANNNQPLSMERSAAWVFTQPLFASEEAAASMSGRDQKETLMRLESSRHSIADDKSDSSGEMASTRSDFSYKWNYNFPRTSRANSVRSIPSRMSVSSIGPSRANSCRGIARVASAKVSDSSSDSGRLKSSE